MSVKDFQIISKLGSSYIQLSNKARELIRQFIKSNGLLIKQSMHQKNDKEKLNALNEVRILASVKCQNIVSYKEAFIDEGSQSLCIVMEFVNGGDLYQRIVDYQKKSVLFPEHEIWTIFIQIVKGLKALHDLKIFHRDLKSANVFLNKDGTVKLGDMNVSKIAKKGLLYTQTGTPYYASPEVWKDQPYDQKSDIWSLGCVLYEMTTLKPQIYPFEQKTWRDYIKKLSEVITPKFRQHIRQTQTTLQGLYYRYPHYCALLAVIRKINIFEDKILQLPSVIQRMDDKLLIEVAESSQLLQTIKITKNLHYLTERLPKANYSPMKMKVLDKTKFVQTLGVTTEEYDKQSDIQHNRSELSLNKLPTIHKRSVSPEKNYQVNFGSFNILVKNDSMLQSEIENDLERRKKNYSKQQDESTLNKQKYIGAAQSLDNHQDKNISINQIYGGGIKKLPKKKAIKLKSKHAALLLDIEGEAKPLSLKSKVNKRSVVLVKEDSSMEQYESKLPSIQKQSQLPQIMSIQKSNKQLLNRQIIEDLYLKQKENILQEERINKMKRQDNGKKPRDGSNSNGQGSNLLPEIGRYGSKQNQYIEVE